MDWTTALVGLASLLFGVIATVAVFSSRVTKTETRQDQHDADIEGQAAAIEKLRGEMNSKFDRVNAKLDTLLERRMHPRAT